MQILSNCICNCICSLGTGCICICNYVNTFLMYLNTYNYFKYFCYNKIVKSNEPLIIKSVQSAMHSLSTPLVHTFCVCQLHLHPLKDFLVLQQKLFPEKCRLMDKRFEELMFIRCNQ